MIAAIRILFLFGEITLILVWFIIYIQICYSSLKIYNDNTVKKQHTYFNSINWTIGSTMKCWALWSAATWKLILVDVRSPLANKNRLGRFGSNKYELAVYTFRLISSKIIFPVFYSKSYLYESKNNYFVL